MPLVDVDKGSRQNGSVSSEEVLAPRTGSIGPSTREAWNRYWAVTFTSFALCDADTKCRIGPSSLRRCGHARSGRVGSG